MTEGDISRIWLKLDHVCECVQASALATKTAAEAAQLASVEAHQLAVQVASIQTDVSWLKDNHNTIYRAAVGALFTAILAIVFMVFKIK